MNYSPFLLWSLGIGILVSNAHIGVFAADAYVLRPLDETIEHLGLQQFFADIPELELAKTSLNQRCEKAVCI